MSEYWDGVKNRLRMMMGETRSTARKNTGFGHSGTGNERRGTGSGYSGTGHGSTGTGGQIGDEWEKIWQKFRQIEGRDPYNLQELKDWWNHF